MPFSTETKAPTTWTPFVPLKHWVCKWNQPTRVRCGKSLLEIQLWRRSCDSRKKVGQSKKTAMTQQRNSAKPPTHLVFDMAVYCMEPEWWFPAKLRRQVLDLLHECHFGIQLMKQLAIVFCTRCSEFWNSVREKHNRNTDCQQFANDKQCVDLPLLEKFLRTPMNDRAFSLLFFVLSRIANCLFLSVLSISVSK